MIEREEIGKAFRICLRREVESEETYAHFAGLDSLDSLYAVIFNSLEFRGRLPLSRPIGIDPLEIETEASPEALARMVEHVEATWSRLGETEPHWSVLTDPRFKAERFAENHAEYRASGQGDEASLKEAAIRVGIDLSRYLVCLELGCGTGRVTEWLAKRFASVIAVDISRSHLEAARSALSGLSNVTLLNISRINQLTTLPAFDVLYSRIVLQHNPPPVISAILRHLLGALNPGGIAFIQLPVWIDGYKFRVADYLAGISQGPMEMHAFPQRELLTIIQEAQCRVRELREDMLGPQFGGISNTILIEKDASVTEP